MRSIRMRILVGFILTVPGFSCVSTGGTSLQAKAPDELQRRIQTWLGMPRSDLEKSWGLAGEVKDMGQGLRYLHYRPKTETKAQAKAKPKAKPLNCEVVFAINITGNIFGGQWTGDRKVCMQFVQGVPTDVVEPGLVVNPRTHPI